MKWMYQYSNCSSSIDSIFTWFITASVTNVLRGICRNNGFLKTAMYYNHIYLHDSINNIHPKFDHYVLLKNNDVFVKNSLSLPPYDTKTILCFPKNHLFNILNGLISSDIIQMIHAEAIDEVIQLMNFESSEKNLINIVCDKLNMQFLIKNLN